jgi:hypothetical protein
MSSFITSFEVTIESLSLSADHANNGGKNHGSCSKEFIYRMTTKRLSIGQLQIYFDDQKAALFSDGMRRDRAAVEVVLAEYRHFIDRWLDASEEMRPRMITAEERELRAVLTRLGRDLGRTGRFDAVFIKTVIQEVARYVGKQSPGLTEIQISETIEDITSAL